MTGYICIEERDGYTHTRKPSGRSRGLDLAPTTPHTHFRTFTPRRKPHTRRKATTRIFPVDGGAGGALLSHSPDLSNPQNP